MKKNTRSIKLLTVIFVLGFFFTLPRCNLWADTFDLSYTLTEGGYVLDFNAANPYKGVRIDVSTDIATRYEIVQRILQPLADRENPSNVIRDNFVVRGLSGTNRYGTFYVPTADTPVRSNQVLYTSNSAGDADNFTVVYGITRMEDIPAGHYYGRISLTLNPIGSTSKALVTKYLDVNITISEEEGAKPSVEITTLSGIKAISLNPKKEEAKAVDILFKINGRFKNQFNIVQQLQNPLESNEGNRLGYEAVKFTVREIEKGTSDSLNQAKALSNQQQTLYTSLGSGEADENFVITYSLGDLSKEKAGRYKSRLQYYLETQGKLTRLDTLDFEIVNERIFDLIITTQDQMAGIQFQNLKPQEPPRVSEVTIEVKTNIGKKYQVSQNVYSDLTNKEGKTIPPEYFSLRTERMDTKGALKFLQETEVKKGDSILFISDGQGSADIFKVIYELSSPKDLQAGDYSTRIIYSLLEI